MTDPLGCIRTAIADRYEILREIGQGAFAVVYLARDLRHDRTVAVKVLNASTGSENSELRFVREIHLLAKLQHPNILPLIDSGHVATTLYYVTPYVSGESLRERLLRERQLSLRSAITIAREIAEALDCAHRDGIVHRDIKPENILLSAGHAIVADFGIAQAIDAAGVRHLTRTGVGSPGTPAYMSPEQLLGEGETDARSDIYSLGCVLFEMLTGKAPFASREDLHKRITESPPSLRSVRKEIPRALESIVLKSLARAPDQRYQNAAEFAERLGDQASPGHRSRLGLLTIASLLLLVLLASAGVYWRRGHSPIPETAQGLATIAVLPFSNTDRAASEEYFSDGMTDELAHALSGLPHVQVAARTSSYAFKDKPAPVQQIGKALNVGAIVEGTVRRSGDRLRVTAALTNAADGLVLWSGVYESRSKDVFQVQDSLTEAIVAAITPALEGKKLPAVPSTNRGTENADAYDLYLRGRYFLAKRGGINLERATGYFRKAIAKDPRFARAYAGLALTYLVLPSYTATRPDSIIALAIQSARQSLAIDSTLADAQIAMGGGLASEFKLTEAQHYFETAIRLEPGNAPAHFWYGIMFRLSGNVEGDLRELTRAAELDPLSAVTRGNLAYAYYAAGQMSAAIEQARRILEIDSTAYPAAYFYLGLPYLFSGKPDSALSAFETAYKLNPDGTGSRGLLTFGLAAAGRWRDAERVRAEIATKPRALLDMVFADLAFGDWDRALDLLERLQNDGYLGAMNISLGCSPLFSPLKGNPRYLALTKKLGIHSCEPVERWPVRRPSQ